MARSGIPPGGHRVQGGPDERARVSPACSRSGEPDSALVHYRLRSAWKDSIFTEERSVQVAELEGAL